MAKLTGKTVFITGASSGIGAALARRCAREGAAVALVARRADRLETLVTEIRRDGGRALSFITDVTRDGDLEAAALGVREAFGGIDVVIANAGFGVAGRLERLTLADFRRQFETNVFGVLRTIYATLPELKRSKGSLVMIGSVSGHVAVPETSAYSMSKAAVGSLAQALRSELATDGVSVVLITPGFVESEARGPRDFVPAWLRMESESAAAEIIDAIVRGERERVLTRHGKAAVFLARHTPEMVTRALGLGGRLMRRRPRKR